MVTRIKITENNIKLRALRDKIDAMIRLHNSALITYAVRGELKTLPQTHIDGLIQDYKDLKAQVVADFEDLL